MEAIYITSKRLDHKSCTQYVTSPSAGGIVVFVGTVRNATNESSVTHLEFEAYEPMAIKEMAKIADTAKEKWGLHKILIHHRVGKVAIGEEAVIIACSSAHRKEAFQACEFAIDTLKETVPIWKKEFLEDGEVWVSAHP